MNPRDVARHEKDHGFRRVYIIGAGFTAHMGYPLGSQLIERIEAYLQGEPCAPLLRVNSLRKNALLGVRNVRQMRAALARLKRICGRDKDRAPPGGSLGCAEFYTIAHMLSENPALLGITSRKDPLPLLYDTLAAVTRTLFVDIITNVGVMKGLPAAIVNNVRPQYDAIVDFNWDEEVDIALTDRYDVAYTRESWRSQKGRSALLLKPHGSIGWYDIMYGIRNVQPYFICENDERIPRKQRRIISYRATTMPIPMGEGNGTHELGFPPVITPPTFRKEFRYREQHVIWQDAVAVMSGAREFVFLGYSLPPDDYLTRAALRLALLRGHNRNIRCLALTNSAESVLSNFESVFGPEHFTQERNVLECDFSGRRSHSVVRMMEQLLKDAHVF